MTQTSKKQSTIDVERSEHLGEMLVARGLISRDQLDAALNHQAKQGFKHLVGEVLIDLNLVSENEMLEVLAESYGAPFGSDLSHIVDRGVVDVLPRAFLEEHCVLPLFLVRNTLTIAVAEPSNVFLVEEVERITGHHTQIVVASKSEIAAGMRTCLNHGDILSLEHSFESADTFEQIDHSKQSDSSQISNSSELEEKCVELFQSLIRLAITEKATHLHIEPRESCVQVRLRVNGLLVERDSIPVQRYHGLLNVLRRISGISKEVVGETLRKNIRIKCDGRTVNISPSILSGHYGEVVSIRINDGTSLVRPLNQLGLSDELNESYVRLLDNRAGLVMVAGPVASGKTTVLYSTIAHLKQPGINISTVESCVATSLDGINQFATGSVCGFTPAAVLRELFHQDCDVIAIDEVTDREAAKEAVHAACAGRLVIASIAACNATDAVVQMESYFEDPKLFNTALKGILVLKPSREKSPEVDLFFTSQRIDGNSTVTNTAPTR